MFKWLTRGDGDVVGRVKRRVASPRGSVFTEFALVMPIALLMCSALIELLCFWDAQVMANHTAWQVGRIAMVRGADGMKFSSAIDRKSSTGIATKSMPDSLKNALVPFENALHTVNLFNDRGNITALFMMSTCGIGYFGASPGKTVTAGFKELLEAGVKAISEGIPELIKGALDDVIKFPSFGGIGTSLEDFIKGLVGKVIDKIVEAAIKPITAALEKLLKAAAESIFGKDGVKLDELFSNTRTGRQLFGAASRIARAKNTTGLDAVVVSDMNDDRRFVFAAITDNRYLTYPEVADKSTTSDGYFVTGAHGWPPNNQSHAMVSVEVNWPFEQGWLFPVVSGFGGGSSAPVAKGHSMVFPQPGITPENLYSVGAEEFEDGDYTNSVVQSELDALAKEMRDYFRRVKFCMEFRTCREKLTLGDEAWYAYSWKNCVELKALFDIGEGKGGGDYALSWSGLTDGKDQDATIATLKGYFNPASYHNRDYFYWDGSYHRSYREELCTAKGDVGFGAWFDANPSLCYKKSDSNVFNVSPSVLARIHFAYAEAFRQKMHPAENFQWFRERIEGFAGRNKVNIPNVCSWQTSSQTSEWATVDAKLHQAAVKADKSFRVIYGLVEQEIKEVQRGIDGEKSDIDDSDDPVFDEDDEEVLKDPESAVKRAWNKWNRKKKDLRACLAKLDAAVVDLRTEWTRYRFACANAVSFRKKWTAEAFADTVLRAMLESGSTDLLDDGRLEEFTAAFRSAVKDGMIPDHTAAVLASVEAWQRKLDAAYKAEIEYGEKLGLASAKKRKEGGSNIEDFIDSADEIDEEGEGTLSEGSDSGAIIDKDRQSYGPGGWQWR